jgi:hypothetical protein
MRFDHENMALRIVQILLVYTKRASSGNSELRATAVEAVRFSPAVRTRLSSQTLAEKEQGRCDQQGGSRKGVGQRRAPADQPAEGGGVVEVRERFVLGRA